MGLIIPRRPEYGGGAALTYQGTAPGQAVYWELSNPGGTPWGYLKWPRTRTDKAGLTVNYYYAPASNRQLVRYGTGRVYGAGAYYGGKVLETADTVTVRIKV